MTTSMKTQKMIAPMSEAERVQVLCTHTHELPSLNTWDEHIYEIELDLGRNWVVVCTHTHESPSMTTWELNTI